MDTVLPAGITVTSTARRKPWSHIGAACRYARADESPIGRAAASTAGTSGFSYPAWAPRFYAPGTRAADLLPAYAARLNACELNNTFYQQPKPPAIGGWLAATDPEFRFSVKAQRGGSVHALLGGAAETVPWLTAPYRLFGERLGTVLFRVPDPIKRNDAELAQLLAAWPRDLPLTMEFQHESWRDDEVHAQLMAAGSRPLRHRPG